MTAGTTDDRDDLDDWVTHYGDYYPIGSRLDREFRASRLLVLASRSWIHRIDNILRNETGQTRARWQVLFTLGFGDQPATMTDIGHRLRVQWPTMVRVVEGMERDGLIAREDNPNDRRSRLLRLTPEGDRVITQIQPTLDRERAQILSDFSDQELEVCERILKKIFEATMRPRNPRARS